MKFEHVLLFFIFLTCFPARSVSQETSYFPGFQSILPVNPGFTGSGPDGSLKISYMNFFPGNHFNLHSGYMSYDSYFDFIHGGAGFFISNDFLGGILNDLRGGLSYSYFLQASEELSVNLGLSASFFHRGFNLKDAVFPDQIDLMGNISLPSGDLLENESITVFDVGAGFVFDYKNMTGSFAVTHLTRPVLSRKGSEIERLDRKYSLAFIYDFLVDRNREFYMKPVALVELQGNYFAASTGTVVTYNQLSANILAVIVRNGNMDIQAGFSFRKDNLGLFYNYRFNISSHNTRMPFSLMHQTGLVLSMNKVEKRTTTGTINLPLM